MAIRLAFACWASGKISLLTLSAKRKRGAAQLSHYLAHASHVVCSISTALRSRTHMPLADDSNRAGTRKVTAGARDSLVGQYLLAALMCRKRRFLKDLEGAVPSPRRGRDIVAQGRAKSPGRRSVALGAKSTEAEALKGRHMQHAHSLALSGLWNLKERVPRAAATLAKLALPCPGLLCYCPFGARTRLFRKSTR